MELAFKSKYLRALCESEKKADKTLGIKVTKKLKARLEDIQAAANAVELTVGNPHIVNSGTQQHMVVNLDEGYSIEFSANHISNPVTPSGTMNWSKVRRVKILTIRKSDG